MNKKKLIQIIVVIVCFAASGVVIYNGLFAKKQNNAPSEVLGLPGASKDLVSTLNTEKLLPYGENLKLDETLNRIILNNQRLRYGLMTFPELNPSTDVGMPVDQMIKPNVVVPVK